MKKLTALLILAFASTTQAAPSVDFASAGFSFVDFLASDRAGKPLESGKIDTNNTLFWFAEQQDVVLPGYDTPLSSYYIFFDPKRAQRVTATLDFGAEIVGVFDSWHGLHQSAEVFGVDTVRYGNHLLDGLEWPFDQLSYSGSQLSLNWLTSDPGDHIRVIVQGTVLPAVPEPEGYAMLLSGLGMLGLVARHRLGGGKR